MASATTDGDDVVLELIDPSAVQNELRPEKVTSISTSGVESWNLGLLLQSPSVKVRANRNRQVVFTDQFLRACVLAVVLNISLDLFFQAC